jgi:cell division protein FtsB
MGGIFMIILIINIMEDLDMVTMEWIVGTLIGIVGLLLVFMGYSYNKNRNRQTDMQKDLVIAKAEAKEYGSLIQKIQTLTDNVAAMTTQFTARIITIETRADERQANCIKHGETIIIAEAKASSAHKRLDEHVRLFEEINRKLDNIMEKQIRGE